MLPKILIVDDEAPTREALTRTLRKDFEILEASSVDDALKTLSEIKDILIVLADEKMPGKTGTDLLTEVKILYPSIARVMISGHIQLEQMTMAINDARIHRFILKPWDNNLLRLQLQEALMQHRNLDEIQKWQKLAVTDPVTNLTNHRFFQERLREEVERSLRHARPLSLIMVDVDHFKKFNDTYGHPEGDKALAKIAHLLKTATRLADCVSRYGGEEFGIILPETTKKVALEVAGRIRYELENVSVGGSVDDPHTVTLSLGVSACPEDGKTAEELISTADQALYQAKQKGRNCVVAFGSIPRP